MLEVSSLTILELWKGIFIICPYVPMNPYEFLNSLPFFIFFLYIPYIDHILIISTIYMTILAQVVYHRKISIFFLELLYFIGTHRNIGTSNKELNKSN